jgi:hypothetical protein
MSKPNRWSPGGRLAIALVMAMSLLCATAVDTFAGSKTKFSCTDASWDCTFSVSAKRTK